MEGPEPSSVCYGRKKLAGMIPYSMRFPSGIVSIICPESLMLVCIKPSVSFTAYIALYIRPEPAQVQTDIAKCFKGRIPRITRNPIAYLSKARSNGAIACETVGSSSITMLRGGLNTLASMLQKSFPSHSLLQNPSPLRMLLM